jgi:hypothetical protein
MKTLQHWRRDGSPLNQTLRAFAGMEPWPETKEDRALRKEAEAEAKAERAAIQSVEREAEEANRAARLAARRIEAGPPEAPQRATGYYRCGNLDGAFFPVGSGPWPDYRPPGLVWDRAWKESKPADVPWADELPPPKVWAREPEPIRGAVGKVQQGRLF